MASDTGEIRHWKIGGFWGHHVSFMGGEPRVEGDRVLRSVYGHQPLLPFSDRPRFPKVGDLLTCEMKSGRTGQFRFVEVKIARDPDDMFTGTVEDAGYVDADSGGPSDG